LRLSGIVYRIEAALADDFFVRCVGLVDDGIAAVLWAFLAYLWGVRRFDGRDRKAVFVFAE
jgi:hypothetical protein